MRHPAPFSDSIIDALAVLLHEEANERRHRLSVLDPFAGTGRVHELRSLIAVSETWGVEIEPEWAAMHPGTIQGDATSLPARWTGSFDAIVTSPTYGNRMADHHDAKDESERVSYRHVLGRPLHPHNSGQLQFGISYQALHADALVEMVRVVKPGGLVLVNVSDHVRGGDVVPVVEWWRGAMQGARIEDIETIEVSTKRLRRGANHDSRVSCEVILKGRTRR